MTAGHVPPTVSVSTPPERSNGTGLRANTLVVSASSLANGLLNAAMLAYAARQGQTAEIAAYSVMTAALTWVAILVMGGSSLLYVSGDEHERLAARSQRLLIALPVMAAATCLIAGLYAVQGYAGTALVAAGCVLMLNSLAELRYSDLIRQLRFVGVSAALTGTRVLALGLLIVDVPLTAALATGAAIYLLLVEVLARRDGNGVQPIWSGLSGRAARGAFRLNRRLFGHSIGDAFSARAGTLALSLVASPHVVGCYGALVSIYQALVAVVFSGLRVPMAMRTRRRHRIGPPRPVGREAEIISTVAATVVAAGIVGLAPWLATDVLGLDVAGAAVWLQLLAVALPFASVNRAFALSRIGDGDYRAATRTAAAVAVIVLVGLLAQATTLTPTGTAAVAGIAELIVAVAILTAAARRRIRRPAPASPESQVGTGHASRPGSVGAR
ncbi:lipopolysaccharide biosynthesis protein [Micromonospora sp. LOL_024]|uniref:lipopolysaccharide biosynthesis protein n=1 Tax=Micromonospora sp. LOL_024 TaxID=3345412 RepID=UPI003A87E2D0